MAQKTIEPKITGVPKAITAQMPSRKTASIVGGAVGSNTGMVPAKKIVRPTRVPGLAG